MLCSKCKKYHSKDHLCIKVLIVCSNCNHKQKTQYINFDKVKCAVCNKYSMRKLP